MPRIAQTDSIHYIHPEMSVVHWFPCKPTPIRLLPHMSFKQQTSPRCAPESPLATLTTSFVSADPRNSSEDHFDEMALDNRTSPCPQRCSPEPQGQTVFLPKTFLYVPVYPGKPFWNGLNLKLKGKNPTPQDLRCNQIYPLAFCGRGFTPRSR